METSNRDREREREKIELKEKSMKKGKWFYCHQLIMEH